MEEESYNEAVENRESRGLAGYASVSQSVSYFAVPPPARSLHHQHATGSRSHRYVHSYV